MTSKKPLEVNERNEATHSYGTVWHEKVKSCHDALTVNDEPLRDGLTL